jgi:RNA polymerase sigma factor (sigma-70 family)
MTATSPNRNQKKQSPPQQQQQVEVADNNRLIFQDSSGTINRQLAESLWDWEQEHRKRKQLPPLKSSVRAGLRWVHEAVEQALQQNHPRRHHHQQQEYSDLVQEGLGALMEAMSQFDEKKHTAGWETYARTHIQRVITTALDRDEHPIRLPPVVRKVVNQARAARLELLNKYQTSSNPNRVITVDMIAKHIKIEPEQLKKYLQWYNRYTSSSNAMPLESTVEILHPMLEDSGPHFVDIDDWESQQSHLLIHNGPGDDDVLIQDYYLDEPLETEGDDDAWIQEHAQIAGRLQDMIPDSKTTTEPKSFDDRVLEDLIRENLGSFLHSNLKEDELTVVQMAFGLEGRQPASFRQMAAALNLADKKDASQLLEQALSKLRQAYKDRYLEPHDVEGDDEFGTESV